MGFSPKIPQNELGTRIEPLVSEPSESGARPAAVAAPDPEADRESRSKLWEAATDPTRGAYDALLAGLDASMPEATAEAVLADAIAQEADIFISADFKYHEFFDADGKLTIADIGHFESEQFTKELFFEVLSKRFSTFAINFSRTVTNPISYL